MKTHYEIIKEGQSIKMARDFTRFVEAFSILRTFKPPKSKIVGC